MQEVSLTYKMTRGIFVKTRPTHVYVTKLISGARLIDITFFLDVVWKGETRTKWRVHVHQIILNIIVVKMLLKENHNVKRKWR